MEASIIQVNVMEKKEATMARFVNGLNFRHSKLSGPAVSCGVRKHDTYGYNKGGTITKLKDSI